MGLSFRPSDSCEIVFDFHVLRLTGSCSVTSIGKKLHNSEDWCGRRGYKGCQPQREYKWGKVMWWDLLWLTTRHMWSIDCRTWRSSIHVCVILEQDEGRKTWSKPGHYVEMAVSRFHSGGIRILFSQSQTHSTSLLASLGSSEATRGHSISLTAHQTQSVQPAVMKLLQNIPGLTYLIALYLSTTFTSLKDLLHW